MKRVLILRQILFFFTFQSEFKMEPTDLSLKSTSKKPRYATSSPRDVTNLDTSSRTSSKDLRRSAFQPVAPSATGIVPPALPYPAFLAGQAGHVLTGTISVYSDILQQQLHSTTTHHHSNTAAILNTSFSHSGNEDDSETSPSRNSRHKNNNNKKQTKSKISKVKNYTFTSLFVKNWQRIWFDF